MISSYLHAISSQAQAQAQGSGFAGQASQARKGPGSGCSSLTHSRTMTAPRALVLPCRLKSKRCFGPGGPKARRGSRASYRPFVGRCWLVAWQTHSTRQTKQVDRCRAGLEARCDSPVTPPSTSRMVPKFSLDDGCRAASDASCTMKRHVSSDHLIFPRGSGLYATFFYRKEQLSLLFKKYVRWQRDGCDEHRPHA